MAPRAPPLHWRREFEGGWNYLHPFYYRLVIPADAPPARDDDEDESKNDERDDDP